MKEIFKCHISRELSLIEQSRLIDFLAIVFLFVFSERSTLNYLSGSIFLLAIFSNQYSKIKEYVWLVVFVFSGITLALNYLNTDNHQYLFVYFALLRFLTIADKEKFRAGCRLLIAFVFLIALFQKISNPEFLNGNYMKNMYLFDSRVTKTLLDVLRIDPIELQTDHLTQLLLNGEKIKIDTKLIPKNLDLISKISTFWTLFIEMFVTLSFFGIIFANHRNTFLLLFVLTTYIAVPILGFCCLLCILGIGQLDKEDTKTYLKYLVSFFAIWILSSMVS